MAKYVCDNVESLKHAYWLLPFNSALARDFLSTLDVYVYKTRSGFEETCPMSILEAMASGLPVVAERKGGIVDLVCDGETGFLCDHPAEYQRAVALLHQDRDRRDAMSRAARAWASEHVGLARYSGLLMNCL